MMMGTSLSPIHFANLRQMHCKKPALGHIKCRVGGRNAVDSYLMSEPLTSIPSAGRSVCTCAEVLNRL